MGPSIIYPDSLPPKCDKKNIMKIQKTRYILVYHMIIVLVKRLKQKPNKLVVLRLRYVDLIIYHHIFSGFLLPQKQRP